MTPARRPTGDPAALPRGGRGRRGRGRWQTQEGITQTALGIRYIVDPPDVIFIPGNAEATRKSYEYQASIIPTAVKDPSIGPFSDTWSRKSGPLGTLINDANNDILSGRKPVSSFDEVLKTWRSQGWRQGPYEQAIQSGVG